MTFTPGISGTQPTFSESQHPSHHSTHMEKLFSPHIHSNSSFDLSNSISNFISFKVMSTSHLQHIPLSTTNYSSSFHLFFFFFVTKFPFKWIKSSEFCKYTKIPNFIKFFRVSFSSQTKLVETSLHLNFHFRINSP